VYVRTDIACYDERGMQRQHDQGRQEYSIDTRAEQINPGGKNFSTIEFPIPFNPSRVIDQQVYDRGGAPSPFRGV
jgi:hypothetical protein